MSQCNIVGIISAEIKDSFNVVTNQKSQQYNECITNSKCENIGIIYSNIQNSNNVELNENLIQDNFCTIGSNCMNIGTISSETLMEEARSITVELNQENNCKKETTCISIFDINNDFDTTTSNFQNDICNGSETCTNIVNSKTIQNVPQQNKCTSNSECVTVGSLSGSIEEEGADNEAITAQAFTQKNYCFSNSKCYIEGSVLQSGGSKFSN